MSLTGVTFPVFITVALLACTWLVNRVRRIGAREPGLPPGPPTVPLLGNLHLFPTRYAHLKFTEWAKTYGDIYTIKIASSTAVVINTPRLVKEYLEKRSATTSDRPASLIAHTVTGGYNIALARYGPVWKGLRRTMQMFLTKEACNRHAPIMRAEATQLMYDFLKQPERFLTHVERTTASVILSTVFGMRCPRYESSIISEFFQSQRRWEAVLEPGAHPPVDLIPALKYVPERWASWKTHCRDIRRRQQKLYLGLRDHCEDRIKEKRRNGCFMEDVIDQQEKLGLNREMIGYVGGACLEGGSDNSSIYLHAFLCCIIAYPEVQARAHKEIDEVIGSNRTPTMDDIENLPYVQAIMKELHRFRPVVPLSLPHASTADEMIDGYLVPAGSMIFMNIYGISHDEEAFEKPEVFMPERFLDSEFGTKPGADNTARRNDFAFGAGRRVCPGIQLGTNTVTLNIMNLLWAFEFKPAKDPQTGKEIPVSADNFTHGLVTGPLPFKAEITPRSQSHIDLIRSEYAAARSVFSQFEQELSTEDEAFVATW